MIGIFILLIIAMLLVIKFCKKTLKIILSIIIILATIWCIMISIDKNRISTFREPIIARLSQSAIQGGSIIYKGAGYRIEAERNEVDRIIGYTMYIGNKVYFAIIE